MGRRSKNRIEICLPVRIWGMDAAGKPFTHFVHTNDINRNGARLAGVPSLLALGDVIGLQYKQLKARCKVVWMGRPGTAKQDQIAIEVPKPEVAALVRAVEELFQAWPSIASQKQDAE